MAKTAGQKSKLYSKYGKQLYVVAKNGGASPEINPSLQHLIEKAKNAARVSSHVIEKCAGEGQRSRRRRLRIGTLREGFGPGNTSVIVEPFY